MSLPLISECVGLGDKNAAMRVYIANRPAFSFAMRSQDISPLIAGEINAIGNACGNGWRKVFNVYAKLMFAIPRDIFPFEHSHATWQDFRDNELLRHDSNTALLFAAPDLLALTSLGAESLDTRLTSITIIMGRTYAKSLSLPSTLMWLTPEFAIDSEHKLIVCPYFDYRQLSNIKITYLVELIQKLTAENAFE